ncbi:CRE-LIM-8 protein, partial [Aphelenchoides avenae]
WEKLHRVPELDWTAFIIARHLEQGDITIVSATVEVEKDGEYHLLRRHPEVEELRSEEDGRAEQQYAEIHASEKTPIDTTTCEDVPHYANLQPEGGRKADLHPVQYAHESYEREVTEKYVSDSHSPSAVAYSPTYLSQQPIVRTRIRPAARPEYGNVRSRNIPIRVDYRERPRSQVDVSPTVIYNPRYYMAELSSEISPVSFKYYDRYGREIGPEIVGEHVDGRRPYDEDPKEWRQFVSQQRLPVPGHTDSRNRIDADSRFRIIHRPVERDGSTPRPIITTVSDRSHSPYSDYSKPEKPLRAFQEKINGAEHDQLEEPVMTVSGRQRCAHCSQELGRGAAMIIESLNLFYHLSCFRCYVCNAALGNGTRGADVRVRGVKLHCQRCYSNDAMGLKYSRI